LTLAEGRVYNGFTATRKSKDDHPFAAWKEARMDRDTLIERLMAENDEFRRLRNDHQAHDHELAELVRQAPLSASQQWRISELKKLKLMAKDRMESIIHSSSVTA
jgi:uncharacterized protein YdcH (DUF465 family)